MAINPRHFPWQGNKGVPIMSADGGQAGGAAGKARYRQEARSVGSEATSVWASNLFTEWLETVVGLGFNLS
ncbi:hypothetical protein [Nocardia gipuzkoensis]